MLFIKLFLSKVSLILFYYYYHYYYYYYYYYCELRTRLFSTALTVLSLSFHNSKRTGKKIINATVPDTITSWYANAFAMSSQRGIGVAPSTSLKVFQPFFVSLTLPYSVIRGEELTVITTVFNYMSSCMTVSRTITSLGNLSHNPPRSKYKKRRAASLLVSKLKQELTN